LTWDFVQQLKGHTSMKVLIKEIVTAEDARLAVENGIDGVIVSNHPGRAENSLRSTIESLPEVVDAVQGRMVVLVDGGFRRGVDFFKALAVVADGVCIGRPYLCGLASFGQAGVEAVLDLLKRELESVMRQTGTTSIRQIQRSHVVERSEPR
jgi:4-hydroxymandelate oxidase